MNDMPTSDTPAVETAETNKTATPGLASTVHSIARYLDRDEYKNGISTGDLADLRRIKPEQPYTPALWKILLERVPNDDRLSEDRERHWAILLQAMATCVGLHDPKTDFGAALAEAGWSELRFVRLMEARDDNLEKELRRLAQYLASKNQSANWANAAWLLFSQNGETAESIRQSIARSYYKRKYALENQGND